MGQRGKFNLFSNLSARLRPAFRPQNGPKALTLQGAPSIRTANGGGRNPAAAVL
jgi:hypothetical protein